MPAIVDVRGKLTDDPVHIVVLVGLVIDGTGFTVIVPVAVLVQVVAVLVPVTVYVVVVVAGLIVRFAVF